MRNYRLKIGKIALCALGVLARGKKFFQMSIAESYYQPSSALKILLSEKHRKNVSNFFFT